MDDIYKQTLQYLDAGFDVLFAQIGVPELKSIALIPRGHKKRAHPT
jgi:hypothetical protein